MQPNAKTDLVFVCSYIKAPYGFLSRVYIISLKIKRSEMDSRPPKTLEIPSSNKKRLKKRGRKKEKI
jgi:hypothetical protein